MPAWIKRLVERVDRYQQHHAWIGFPYAVIKKFGEDQAGNLAALVAYYAFFSIFPLLLAFVTILGYVLAGDQHLQHQVFSGALNQFPIIGQREASLHPLTGKLLALVVGIAGAIWGGLGVANTLQTALNSIWEVPMVERPSFLKRTLRSLGLLAIVGGGVLATTVVNGFSTGGGQYGLQVGIALRALAALIALAINAVLFTLAFNLLTAREITWRTILPGAVLAAVFWQILQLVGGYYVNHQIKGASQTYGTFAVVIGLLSWLYLQSQLTLLSAEVDTVRAGGYWPRALVNAPQTEGDRRAYEAYAKTQRYQKPERIDLTFEGEGRQDGSQQSQEGSRQDGSRRDQGTGRNRSRS